MTKKIRRLFLCIVLLLFLTAGFYKEPEITTYDIAFANLPDAFDGMRIVQISDFHCESFGKNEDKLINMIEECKPDIIFLTGDMIDADHEMDNVVHLLDGIVSIAPIYSVSGNHENDDKDKKEQLFALYDKYGVVEIDNNSTTISRAGEQICIGGITYGAETIAKMDLKEYEAKNPELFQILLYHYANGFDIISKAGYDLVFSGHLHGGIVRLPFIGGLASFEGLFPKYDVGIFQENGTTMVVSRGLGKAIVPRFFNRPEIVRITIHRTK